MQQVLNNAIQRALNKQVPATGIGIFRSLYGIVALQEIVFLLYFNHLIFDPVPFLDVEFPMIPTFLCLWAVAALALTVGLYSQISAIANYCFWIIFTCFTPMQRDFDGGFDQFMIDVGLFLIFLPIDRAFSLDNLRYKLRSNSFTQLRHPPGKTTVLAYYLPLAICLGFLYFDSAVHKLFAEHWRNGLGAWLPSSHPYYISAIDMSWLLNIEPLQKAIGYLIIAFQFSFIFLFYRRAFRVPLLIIGAGLHLGITLTFNIYPFGLGMLICYTLMVPFSWWRCLAKTCRNKTPSLWVFYDEMCPLCNRTVIIINHFDIFHCISFKSLQSHATEYPALNAIDSELLLTDIYALDASKRLFSGLDTYIQILLKMRYTAPLGLILRIPGIYHFAAAKYRHIADNRLRTPCSDTCLPTVKTPPTPLNFYQRIIAEYAATHHKQFSRRLGKVLIMLFFLQMNSTLHYGIFYRIHPDLPENPLTATISTISTISNAVLMYSSAFIGITPHALYLHDHFAGYERIIGITYIGADGQEQWLPFIDPEGRIVAPNWGRVHSMWANIAVTPKIDQQRLKKFIMKVTAFWGIKESLDLNDATFIIKAKKIAMPFTWQRDLRKKNLASPWFEIGTAKWRHNTFSAHLTIDI